MAVKKKSVKKKATKKRTVAVKKKSVAKKKVVAKKKRAANARKKVRSTADQGVKMAKPSVRAKKSSAVVPAIPPGFQGQQQEEIVLEPVAPSREASRQETRHAKPSLWSHLEPVRPAIEVEETPVEAPTVAGAAEPEPPLSLIEQAILESQQENHHPFAIQPKHASPVEEVDEEPEAIAPSIKRTSKVGLSAYLSLWQEQPRPERRAVVDQLMVDASDEEPANKVVDEVAEVAVEPPVVEALAVETAEPAVAVTPETEIEKGSPLATRTSMLDAVHAVATQAAAQEEQLQAAATETPIVENEKEVPPKAGAQPSHTEQVAEVIRMIEQEEMKTEEEKVAAEEAPQPAMEAAPKGDFSAEIQAAADEEDDEEIDDPHFNDALDKIAGTRSEDTAAAQRREAIRHFTESAAKKRADRRNRVATGAPAVVGGLPPSMHPRETKVEVESLGGGILHLLGNGVKGIASLGRYSMMGFKYGLEDSKNALGKITSKG